MIFVSDSLTNLYISVWAETWRSRLDTEVLDIRAMRLAAQERHDIEHPIMQVSDWTKILEASAGYENSPYVVPYAGPRPYFGYRPVDDPDPRLFLFLTVETAILTLPRYARCLADHTWIYHRGDSCFRFEAEPGELNPVPKGRSLIDWCKKLRARTIRPRIMSAIGSRMPENIVESTLLQVGHLSV